MAAPAHRRHRLRIRADLALTNKPGAMPRLRSKGRMKRTRGRAKWRRRLAGKQDTSGSTGSNDEVDAGTANTIRGWTAALIRRAVNAVVPAVFRAGDTSKIDTAKIPLEINTGTRGGKCCAARRGAFCSGGTAYTIPAAADVPTKASNADVDGESDDSDYMTVAKTFRAIARKVKNASTTVRGIVLLARNEDVASSETDLTRVPDVSKSILLIRRLIGEMVRSIPEAEASHIGRPLVANRTSKPFAGYAQLGAEGYGDNSHWRSQTGRGGAGQAESTGWRSGRHRSGVCGGGWPRGNDG